jgi:hypothetical protein
MEVLQTSALPLGDGAENGGESYHPSFCCQLGHRAQAPSDRFNNKLLFDSIDDAAPRRIVGGHRKAYLIAQNYTNTELSHLSRQVAQHYEARIEAYPEHTAGKHFFYHAIKLYMFLLRH